MMICVVCRSTIKLDSIYPYNDANKTKYGKPKVRSGWKEAMEEIEKNIPIEDQDDDDDDEEDTSVIIYIHIYYHYRRCLHIQVI